MGQGYVVSEELSVERQVVLNSPVAPLFKVLEWEVREMVLTHRKMGRLWRMLQDYPTLFSDLTRNTPSAWITQATSPDTYFLEVYRAGVLEGIVYFEGMLARKDIDAHMVFFDRKPAEKVPVSWAIIEYMFRTFPIRSIVVTPLVMYYATIRMLHKLRFRREGILPQAVLVGGKLCDQAIFRITRSDVCPS